MEEKPFLGNVLDQSKYKKRLEADAGSVYQGAVDTGAHVERMTRFHARQGHGYAAEQANDLIDKSLGKDAVILGDDNAKNGPDRMVDGAMFQSKYCQTAAESVNAAFKNHTYRYIDANGHAMQIEVPYDQYEEAIQCMEKKIAEGEVPGVTDPGRAKELVRQGNVDYQTACNIAKAGTVDSLMFDAAHGAVIATTTIGISGLITFAKALWDGRDVEEAAELAMYCGLRSGGYVFVSSVLSAQLTRTAVNTALVEPSIAVVKLLPSNVRRMLVNSMKNGALIYGDATTKDLAKLMRSNFIAAGTLVLVMSAGDICDFFRDRISGKQLFKNVTTLAAGMGGAYAGGMAGAALGATLGPAGAVVGGIIGGMAGGAVAGEAANAVLSTFVEDDAVEMVGILNDRLVPLVQSYLLNAEELDLVLDDLQEQLVKEKLLQMYASKDREAFADELLTATVKKIVCWRTQVRIPSNEMFIKGMGRVLEMSMTQGALQAFIAKQKVDPKAIGKQLLGRDINEHAAKRAWYATKQMNIISMNQAMDLQEIKDSNQRTAETRAVIQQETAQYKAEIKRMLEE